MSTDFVPPSQLRRSAFKAPVQQRRSSSSSLNSLMSGTGTSTKDTNQQPTERRETRRRSDSPVPRDVEPTDDDSSSVASSSRRERSVPTDVRPVPMDTQRQRAVFEPYLPSSTYTKQSSTTTTTPDNDKAEPLNLNTMTSTSCELPTKDDDSTTGQLPSGHTSAKTSPTSDEGDVEEASTSTRTSSQSSRYGSARKASSQDSGIGDPDDMMMIGSLPNTQPINVPLRASATRSDWFGSDSAHMRMLDSTNRQRASGMVEDLQHHHSPCSGPRPVTMPDMASLPDAASSPPVQYQDPCRDTETLQRKSAERHRAVSRRLFEAMQQQRRQGVGLSKSPSCVSSSSSSGTGGNGTAGLTPDDPPSLTRHASILNRSRSTEAFVRYGSFSYGASHLSTPPHSSNTAWNLPQQRRSILAMQQTGGTQTQTRTPVNVASYETEFPVTPSTSSASGVDPVSDQTEANSTNPTNTWTSNKHQTHERVFQPQVADPKSTRGAYRKICNKRQNREEQKVFQLRGLPDPAAPPSPVATSFGPLPIPPSHDDYISLSSCRSNAMASADERSPYYAHNRTLSDKPLLLSKSQSFRHQPGTLHQQFGSGTMLEFPPSLGHSRHQQPPPLPRKPPPLEHLGETSTDKEPAFSRYASTPSLSNHSTSIGDTNLKLPPNHQRYSAIFDSANTSTEQSEENGSMKASNRHHHSNGGSRHEVDNSSNNNQHFPANSVQWHNTSKDKPQSNKTNDSGIPTNQYSKPMVQVHPICQPTPPPKQPPSVSPPLKPTKLAINNGNTKDGMPRPPPPVPRKPSHLTSKHSSSDINNHQPQQPKPTVTLRSEHPNNPPSMTVTDSAVTRAEQRQQLDNVDASCERLSAFVSENDRSLKPILQMRSPQESLMAHCFAATVTVPPKKDSIHISTSMGNIGSGTTMQTANRLSPGDSVRHERSASSSSVQSMSEADVRVLNNLYGRKASTGSLYSGTPASSRTQSPTGADQDVVDLMELEKKKRELISSLSRKVSILEDERSAIQDEMDSNDRVGVAVRQAYEQAGASTNDVIKMDAHVKDTERITRLLLKLSTQLSRVEAALTSLPPEPDTLSERRLLDERRVRLCAQLADARSLRDNAQRRGESVIGALKQTLPDDVVTDYHYFVQMKQKLLVDVKEIEEKLQLGRDQLTALEQSLDPQTATSHTKLGLSISAENILSS